MLLTTVNLALATAKALFEFLSTPEGQAVCREARENRAAVSAWFERLEQKLPELFRAGNPTLDGIKRFFGGAL